MTAADLMGWAAAAMTLLAFSSRDVRLLRLASLGASVAFIIYAMSMASWPVLALHTVLLPINMFRLFELRRWEDGAKGIGAMALSGIAGACTRFQRRVRAGIR